MRVRRRFLLILEGLGGAIALWRPWLGLVVLAVAWAADYWRDRQLDRQRYRLQLVKLRRFFTRAERAADWYLQPENVLRVDTREGSTRPTPAQMTYPDALIPEYQPDSPLEQVQAGQYLTNLRLSELIARYRITGYQVCELGCADGRSAVLFSGGMNAARMPAHPAYRAALVHNRVIGVDLVMHYLTRYHCGLDSPCVLADVQQVPLAAEAFDVVCISQTLQALELPQEALDEACRLLKPGGLLVLATPSRHSLSLSQCLNPLLVTRQILTLAGIERLLPSRQLTFEDQGTVAFMTNFSRKELVGLLNVAGFVILEMRTFHFLRSLHQIAARLWPELRLGTYADLVDAFELRIAGVPLVGNLGVYWLVVARK